jgi:hypothetical protein
MDLSLLIHPKPKLKLDERFDLLAFVKSSTRFAFPTVEWLQAIAPP